MVGLIGIDIISISVKKMVFTLLDSLTGFDIRDYMFSFRPVGMTSFVVHFLKHAIKPPMQPQKPHLETNARKSLKAKQVLVVHPSNCVSLYRLISKLFHQ